MDITFLVGLTITGACYCMGNMIKASIIPDKLIPVLCGLFGVILGIISPYIPGINIEDLKIAATTGFSAGMAATGVHQSIKQNSRDKTKGEGYRL